MIFLRLAARNVTRNRTRTALIVAAVGFSVFISTLVMALSDGSHEAMITTTLRNFTGYGQIQLAPDPKVHISEIVDWKIFLKTLSQSSLMSGNSGVNFEPGATAIINNYDRVPDFGEQLTVTKAINTWLLQIPEKTCDRRAILETVLPIDILQPMSEKTFSKNPLVENVFPYTESLKAILNKCKYQNGYSPRLQSFGMIATEKNSSGALILGVIPSREAMVTNIHKKIFKGAFLEDHDRKTCIIGWKLALLLGVTVDDRVACITRAVDGSTGALKLRVKGLLRSGADEIDKMLLILPLADSEFLLRTEGQVHYIACSSPSAEDVEKMTDDLEPHISKQGLVFLDWKKLIPDLLEFLALDSFFGYIFLGIILTVVVFGILTGIITSVLERTGEFGILIAIGTRPIQIVRLILYESIVITGAGSLLGLGTGLPLAKWLTYNPIELPLSSADVMASYGMENLLHFFVYPEKIALIIAFLFTISILMSLAPAIRAGLLKPYIAIREARR